MRTIDNYGEFEVPEEKSEIEVIENPSQTISSCYEVFTHSVKKGIESELENEWQEFIDREDEIEELYLQAAKTLEGKEKLKYHSKDLKNIFGLLKPSSKNYHILLSGIFLSALHNNADSDLLHFNDINKLIMYLGYNLKPNKILLLGPKTNYENAGINSQGRIINFGIAGNLGTFSSDGMIINHGFITQDVGYQSKEAVIINNNFAKDFGEYSEKGIYINTGVCDYMGSVPENDETDQPTLFNLGVITGNEYAFRKKHFDLTPYIDLTQISLETVLKFRSKLEDKLKEAECLEKLKYCSEEEAAKIVAAFDFRRFKQDIRALAKKIQEEYSKLPEYERN